MTPFSAYRCEHTDAAPIGGIVVIIRNVRP